MIDGQVLLITKDIRDGAVGTATGYGLGDREVSVCVPR
jgi:hypothetical protein